MVVRVFLFSSFSVFFPPFNPLSFFICILEGIHGRRPRGFDVMPYKRAMVLLMSKLCVINNVHKSVIC